MRRLRRGGKGEALETDSRRSQPVPALDGHLHLAGGQIRYIAAKPGDSLYFVWLMNGERAAFRAPSVADPPSMDELPGGCPRFNTASVGRALYRHRRLPSSRRWQLRCRDLFFLSALVVFALPLDGDLP
jgi:hypothetical protein